MVCDLLQEFLLDLRKQACVSWSNSYSCMNFSEMQFGARAHLSPAAFPIFLNFKNASKKSEKKYTETYLCIQYSCKFSTENIKFCALCKKDKNLTDKIGEQSLIQKDRFVFFTQGAKIDIFCRKFTRVLNT